MARAKTQSRKLILKPNLRALAAWRETIFGASIYKNHNMKKSIALLFILPLLLIAQTNVLFGESSTTSGITIINQRTELKTNPLGIDISEVEAVLKPKRDCRNAARYLARDESFAAQRALMVEENSV